MAKQKQHLTSAKLDSDKYDEFKIMSIRTKMTFQKVAERAIDLYLKNEDFRNMIHNHFPNKLGE